MVFFVKDAWVWLEHSDEAWLPVQLKEQNGDKIICKSNLDEEFIIDANLDMSSVKPTSLEPCNNMVKLEELSEGAILHNLRMRYNNDDIYTYISSILISVNPFKMLPIYSPSVMKEYQDKLSSREEMPPHVYALADDTFRSLIIDQTPQSVIISGESGAGKTEATKLVLQYLTEMSGQGSRIEQQLLQANPIIEAFGNAKTVRNNNSSRFGKWIEIALDKDYHIAGARIINYLLEKSRIVAQGPGERNYHAFYQFCAGANKEERKKYVIGKSSEYRYLSGGDCFAVDGIDDSAEFNTMKRALDVMNFTSGEKDFLFSVLSAVMHLGNIKFSGSGDKCKIDDLNALQNTCQLLNLNLDIMNQALITKTIKVVGESITTPLTVEQAFDGVDALSKALYGSLFNWLIDRINSVLHVELEKSHTVGVLDIFGFEIFETNRFEQFCINYANEKLQQHFNEHIFTMEQAEYKEEQISVDHVDFIDNQECLDLIEKKTGILAMTDEEIRIPKGSDTTLLDRLDKTHNSNKYYVKRKLGNPVFTVTHYAGNVTYNVIGFLEKNKDTLDETLLGVIESSGDQNIALLLSKQPDEHKTNDKRPKKKKLITLGYQFKVQLQTLMDTLHKTAPHFIRCIKPNAEKCADYFDSQMVTRQLRYLGVQEVVKIRQLGYPVRSLHKSFWMRYKMLKPNDLTENNDYKALSIALLKNLNVSEDDWRVGTTKVFVRNNIHSYIEKQREVRVTDLMIKVQALARMRIWRSRYKRYKSVKDALVKALTDCKDYKILENAIEEYENLGMATDDDLINAAKRKAKVLYEHAQAIHSLEMALESHDESLLSTALEGARKVKVPENTPIYIKAYKYYNQYIEWKKLITEAMSKRELNDLEKLLNKSKDYNIPQNNPKIIDGKDLLAQLKKEENAKQILNEAIKQRDLNILRNALKEARRVRLSAKDLAHGIELEKQLIIEKDALSDLKHAYESKSPQIDELNEAIEHAIKVGISNNHSQIQEAKIILNGWINEQKKAEAAKKAKKAKELEIKSSVASALNKLEDALKSDELRQVENALKRAQNVQKIAGSEADILNHLIKQCHTKMQQLVNRQSVIKQLQNAIETRLVKDLERSLDAARKEQLNENEAYIRANEILTNINTILKDLDIATKAKDVEKLSSLLNRARHEIASNGPEADMVEKFSRHRDVLVAEKDAEKALQYAVRARNESMLNVALTKAKAEGVTLDDKLVKEAEAIEEEVEQENIIREQELVVAQRRVTVAEQRRTRKATQGRRVSVLATINNQPESKAHDIINNLRSGYSYAEMNQYELYMFPNFRSPAAYAKGKLFGSKKLKAGMLFWTSDNIPTSLTKVVSPCETSEERRYEKKLIQESIQIFKSVQGFMYDRALSFVDGLAQQVLDIAFKTHLLRDELYAQILKQLRRNKKKESIKAGWQLISLCCDLFPPSDEFLPFVLNFIQSSLSSNDTDVKNYANYCIQAIVKILENPVKENKMNIDYISAFKQRVMTAQSILVFFLDQSAISVSIDPNTTVQDVIIQVSKKIGLSTTNGGFALYFEKSGTRKFLRYDNNICECEAAKIDANAYINDAMDENNCRIIKTPPCRFVFIKRMYMGGKMAMDLARDPLGIALMYHQAVFEVSRGNYFLPLKDAANLFAISEACSKKKKVSSVSSSIRDQNYKVHEASTLKPPGVLFTSGKTTKSSFEKMVEEARSKLTDDVRITDYLRAVSKYPLYGAQFFNVQNTSNKNLPQHLVLAINMGGVYLMDWNTRDLLCFFPVQGIAGWKGNDATFIVRAQMELAKWFDSKLASQQQRKGLCTFYFKTNQGRDVANLVRSYVDALFALVKAKQQQQQQKK